MLHGAIFVWSIGMEIKRDQYLNALSEKRNNGRVKIITGLRRCGKSYLLFNLYKKYLISNGITEDQIIEIALDDIENVRYRNPFELNEFIKQKITNKSQIYYVFIDEIQFCSEVDNPYLPDSDEKITFVDTILGLMKNKNVDIYITGSNSKLLSSDVLTQFRDRGDEIHVFPLSFAEYWTAWQQIHTRNSIPISFPVEFQNADIHAAWREFCYFGGMPYILSLETTKEKSQYLKDLFEETYLKDIIERKKIRNDKDILDILLDFISSSIGSLTNPAKLANRFQSEKHIKISHTTIANYLDFFCEAYIISSANRYDVKGGRYFDTPLKYYFADIGLRNARLNFRQVEENHIMENIIYNELILRGFNVDIGVVPYSTRIIEDGREKKVREMLEVDFVINNINQKYYIQSALTVDDPEKRQQEIKSLNRINDSFRKIVIVKDDILPKRDEKGIFYIGILDFLLNQDFLDR